MHFIAENIKSLRKLHNWTQSDLAERLGVKRSLIGAYEEGRADPRISFLQLVCHQFELSLDDLVNKPIDPSASTKSISGDNLRILAIPIDTETDTERAVLVPTKAAAGYLNGYGDLEYIESLPIFNLPYNEISTGKTYRVFQISGDSMLPIKPGSYIIASYVLDWTNIKNDQPYIVVSKSDGIVFKRLILNAKANTFTLKSDNPEYPPFEASIADIQEVWKAEGVTSFELDGLTHYTDLSSVVRELQGIKRQLEDITISK